MLGNLGSAYRSLGEHRRAIEYLEQAFAILREVGHRSAEGSVLGILGNVHCSLSDLPGKALQQWILKEREERKGPRGILFARRPTLDDFSTMRHIECLNSSQIC